MLTLSKTHDATLTIDDEPVQVHVKRMTKGEAIAFEREFFRHGQRRGTADATDEEQAASRQFIEDSIAAYITVEPGQIVDDGRAITTGEDVIRAFCARGDVLAAVYQLVYSQNFLGKAQKKILSAQPFSFPGSAQSIAPRDGGRPVPIADSAESASTARLEVVMASSEEPMATDARELSGATAP